MQTLWFKVENGPADEVEVRNSQNIKQLKQEIIRQHPRMFGDDQEAGVWHLYKTGAEGKEPEESGDTLDVLGEAGKTSRTALILKRISQTAPFGVGETLRVDTEISKSEPRVEDLWGDQNAIWLGRHGSATENEGISLNEVKVLKRESTIRFLLTQLEKTKILLIKSPPMTGKTSMAALIADSLSKNSIEKVLIINLSMVDFAQTGKSWTFENCFNILTGLHWADLLKISNKRKIYLIFDEVQIIFKKIDNSGEASSPSNKSGIVWAMAKSIMSNENSRISCVFFAAFGSSLQNSEMATPVQFKEGSTMFGIDCLNFTGDEIKEYVQKNLEFAKQISDLELTEFCINLKHLCGSHVGLCQEAISILNDWYRSKMKYGNSIVAKDILLILWCEKTFERLLTTRAVAVADFVSDKESNMLKALFSGQSVSDKKSLQSLAKKGMLVEKNNDYLFSSPVMARYALQKIVGIPAKRTEREPESLEELIIFILSSLDYSHLRSSLGKTKQTGILLERTWQMDFYKTAIQCTPHGCYVSADVGALFGSTGAIDFTIHTQDMKIFWGIELLRESDRINEHIGRFGMEGRYNHLCARFTDHCLVDFRMVETTEAAPGNLNLDNRVFTLCYDRSFSSFRYFSSKYPTGLKLNPEPEN